MKDRHLLIKLPDLAGLDGYLFYEKLNESTYKNLSLFPFRVLSSVPQNSFFPLRQLVPVS